MKKKTNDKLNYENIYDLYWNKFLSIAHICKMLKIGNKTLAKFMKENGIRVRYKNWKHYSFTKIK